MQRFLVFLAIAAASASTAVPVAQAAVVVNVTIPIDGLSAFVSCADGGVGEFVDLSGALHVLESVTSNSNSISGKMQVAPRGVVGIGETTGITYRGVGVTEQTFAGSLLNGRFTITSVNNFLLISGSSNGNLRVHETLQTVINANGDVAVTHDNLTIDCR